MGYTPIHQFYIYEVFQLQLTLKAGSICPIAAMFQMTGCLGAACAWHLPNSKTGCKVTEIQQGIADIDAVRKLIEKTIQEGA
jgi:hypothetical protein